uniref:Uncharacterized protein n=1 Tax=Sonderella linearis TaxID=110477 RepID=A0A1Z1MLU6_9FLOR|nr:hypothetical protein [Sonderella linearis]ARW67018.1 hypothetical protein [Sonderella linearis]
MEKSLSLYFKNLKGKWLSQTNLYLLKNKQQIIYINKIQIIFQKNYLNISNLEHISYQYNLNFSKKNLINPYNFYLNNENTQYIKKNYSPYIHTEIIAKNLLKIDYKIEEKKLKYNEYFIFINSNLIICMGFLKNNKNKYIGTKTTSYIRLK